MEKKQSSYKVLIVTLTVLAVGQAVLVGRAVGDPLKIFIPTGRSNMQAVVLPDKGDAKVEDVLFYIDGGQEDTIISFGTQTIDTASGMDVLISLDGCDGLLDGVRIYSYAISEGDIQSLAN